VATLGHLLELGGRADPNRRLACFMLARRQKKTQKFGDLERENDFLGQNEPKTAHKQAKFAGSVYRVFNRLNL
jgi:hypothetical protein